MKKQIQYTDKNGVVTEFTWAEWEEFQKEQEALKSASKVLPKTDEENCQLCQDYKRLGDGPSHKASSRCQSGGYNHCSCDICF